MVFTTFMLCAGIVFFLFLICYDNCVKPKRFPRGPGWYPFIGCLPRFQKLKKKLGYTHLAFLQLSKSYGDVLGLKIGTQKFVVIHGSQLVKKALLKEQFNGRPDGFFFKTRSFGKDLGILFTEGTQWMQHRKFTAQHLRHFGYGTGAMDQLLTNETREFIQFLRKESDKGPIAMHTIFDVPTLNTLWTMLAGHRYEYEDRKLREILEVVHELFRLNDTLGGILTEVPWIRFIAPEKSGYNEFMKLTQMMWDFISQEITEHEKTLPELDAEPRDLIDAFLMEIKNNESNTDYHIFDRENLLILCFDLFLAGSKTTTDTLATIFCFLGANLHWVKYCRNELFDVVGINRAPTIEDMNRLPKNQAFIAEVQRAVTMTPLGIPHKATENTIFEGYRIPKGTNIILNLYTANTDPRVWNNPANFNPGRFLNSKGEFVQNNAGIPFGLGKRRCLGELMARHSLFLFFVSVIHFFDLEVTEEYGPPEQDGIDGFVVSPKPFYLELVPRTEVFDNVDLTKKDTY